MTDREAVELVKALRDAGVEFDGRCYWKRTGRTIPRGTRLEELDPAAWDVDFVPTFPLPAGGVVGEARERFFADPEFARRLEFAAAAVLMGDAEAAESDDSGRW